MNRSRLEVRINRKAKAAAQDWAMSQGMSLSEAIRRLLVLVRVYDVDLDAIERLLPARDGVIALVSNLGGLRSEVGRVAKQLAILDEVLQQESNGE